jgi:hypothetical protein
MSIQHGDYLEGGGLKIPYGTKRDLTIKNRNGDVAVYKGVVSKIQFPNHDKERTDEELKKDYERIGLDIDKKYPFVSLNKSKEDAIIEFGILRNHDVNTENMSMSIVGNLTLDIFFEEKRLTTKNSQGISQMEMWNDKRKRRKLYEDSYSVKKTELIKNVKNFMKLNGNPQLFKELTDNNIRGGVQHSVGAVSQFKPYVSKWLYNHFGVKSVMDFSSGWGGRMLGAMSLDINYIGIDTNTNLKTPYRELMETLKPYTKSKTSIYFQKAETFNFSKFKNQYDCVLTSPPYIQGGVSQKTGKTKQIEAYENMPEYDFNEFYDTFLKPTIKRAFLNMSDKGVFCLNTNKNNYEELVERNVLPTANRTIVYPTKARAGKTIGDYTEFIYVYNKNKANTIFFNKINDDNKNYEDESPITSNGSGNKIYELGSQPQTKKLDEDEDEDENLNENEDEDLEL